MDGVAGLGAHGVSEVFNDEIKGVQQRSGVSRYSKRSRTRWPVLLVVFLVIALFSGFVFFANALPNKEPVIVFGAASRTDAIVVLTGGTLRLDVGFRLLEAGASERLFVSGVHRGVDVAELLRLQSSAPERLKCCIVLGHDAADTIGNARETAVWARTNGVTSLRLVTAGYHMPRSMLEFRSAMPDTQLIPHPVMPERVKTEQWYRFPGTAWLIAEEYVKYLLAWTRIQVTALSSGLSLHSEHPGASA